MKLSLSSSTSSTFHLSKQKHSIAPHFKIICNRQPNSILKPTFTLINQGTTAFRSGTEVMRGTSAKVPDLQKCHAVPSEIEASDAAPVVIMGAGIIGAATAYYLTQRGIKPIIIERMAVAAAASGKAGGFLARSWGNGGPTQQLHHKSFDLHAELAIQLGVESYRKISTLSVSGGGLGGKNKWPASWLDGDIARANLMDQGTAQVTPQEITSKLMGAALSAGAVLRIGTVVGIETAPANGSEDRLVTGVRLETEGSDGCGAPEIIATSKVVVAMGPWSVLAEDWLPDSGLIIPLEGVKSTSLVYNSEEVRERVSAEPFALFCAEDDNGCHLEVYPRYNGEVYICGLGGSDYVSGARLRKGGDCEHQGLVKADPARVVAASASFANLTSLGRSSPGVTQACMRPCAPDALPIMGEIPGVAGGYIAAGHNCWGILWGPASGLAMSELVSTGQSISIDLSAFSPQRFMATKKSGTRGRRQGSQAVGEQW